MKRSPRWHRHQTNWFSGTVLVDKSDPRPFPHKFPNYGPLSLSGYLVYRAALHLFYRHGPGRNFTDAPDALSYFSASMCNQGWSWPSPRGLLGLWEGIIIDYWFERVISICCYKCVYVMWASWSQLVTRFNGVYTPPSTYHPHHNLGTYVRIDEAYA